jgi:hypothetical protein
VSSDANSVALQALADSLQAFLPDRVVTRTLVNPAQAAQADLLAGVLCLVSGGGGGFANYVGRVGQLGGLRPRLLGLVLVPEKDTTGADVEAAELALLDDVLRWTDGHAPVTVLPMDWIQSQQLEHPYGWFLLDLDVRPR